MAGLIEHPFHPLLLFPHVMLGLFGTSATMPRDIVKLGIPFGQPQLAAAIPEIDARQPV